MGHQDPTFEVGEVAQVAPASPVAGGNDPNASDDVLYILDAQEEDEEEIASDERGILKRNGRAVGSTSQRRAHLFVNPSTRLAGKIALTKDVRVEAFFTGGVGEFDEARLGFGTRGTSLAGGVNATAGFGLFNGAFGYEHRDAYAERFGPWKLTGDKVGATLNKTLPFFIPALTVTPQVQVSRDMVNPVHAASTSLAATMGLTYTLNPRLSVAASGGYAAAFLYGFSGFRHDDGPKASIGATFKATDRLVLTLDGTLARTIRYGLPRYRSDGSLSPAVAAKYAISSTLTLALSASYGRFISTATGSNTFKYNLNPSLALTIPL